ncbi:hypothetical protein [Solibacillus sp. CAU 1738]|uniref:hypothetical protein n=1 Tax=Solibacillus sp. CAU 1738 TaxID=3140363 RepID=UPI0032613468
MKEQVNREKHRVNREEELVFDVAERVNHEEELVFDAEKRVFEQQSEYSMKERVFHAKDRVNV